MEGEAMIVEDTWCKFRHKVDHDLFKQRISFDAWFFTIF